MRNLAIVGGVVTGLIYAVRPLIQEAREPAPQPPPMVATPASGLPSSASAVQPISAARQLTNRARALLDAIDSNAEDFAAAESLVKRAIELDPTDGESWAVSARLNSAYLTRGFERGAARREAARSQAERAVKLAPDSAEAWLALGRGIWTLDSPRAEEALRRALKLAPTDGRILISLGSILRNQDRGDEALAFYEQAAAQPGSRGLARYDQFLIHLYHRRFAEADRCVRDAVATQPTVNNVSGLAMLETTWHGEAGPALRRLAEAPAKFRAEPRVVINTALVGLMAREPEVVLQALEHIPSDYINDAWYTGPKGLLVGFAHTEAGRPEAARLAWQEGLAVSRRHLAEAPNDLEQHLRLAELLAWTGQADEALREVRVVNELLRGRPADWTYSPARVYAALGRADDALPLLEQLLGGNSGWGRWPFTRALLRLDPLWDKLRGDPRFQKLCEEPVLKTEDGGQKTEVSASIDQKSAPAATPLSEGAQFAARARELYTKVGFTRDDLAPAEDFARRATEKEPDSAAAWGVRAGVQSAWLIRGWDIGEKRRQDTQSFANRALALDPNEPEALLALGHVLRIQGASDQAVAHLRRAVAANPDHVRLARALGYTLGLAGRDTEARVVLQETLPRAPRDPLLRYELALSYASYGGGGADPANLAAALEQLDAALAIRPFSSALILKAALIGGWRGDLAGMRAVLDQHEKLPLAERSEDRSVSVLMWAGLMEHRPDRVEAAASLTARNYFEDAVMPLHPKAWWLALAHRMAGKENLARADWQAAEAVLRARLRDEPGNLYCKAELATTLAWLGRREEAARLIGEVEPVWREEPTYRTPQALARYYAAAGEVARAASYLTQTVDRNVFASRRMLALDPWWDQLRGQPEFEALLKEPAAKK